MFYTLKRSTPILCTSTVESTMGFPSEFLHRGSAAPPRRRRTRVCTPTIAVCIEDQVPILLDDPR